MTHQNKDLLQRLAPFGLSLLFALVFCYPLLQDFTSWGYYEWDYSFFLHEVARKTIVEYGQMPLWDPYSYGGQSLVAHPHARHFSPDFLLVILFGTVIGLKLQIILYFALGFCGMFLLSRRLKMDLPAAFLPPVIFMGSSYFTLHMAYGQTYLMGIAFLPWLYLFFLKSQENRYYLIGLTLTLTFIFLNSSPSLIFITLILMAFLSLSRAMKTQSIGPLALMGISFLTSLLLASIRLVPMIEAMRRKKMDAKILHKDYLPLDMLPQIFFSRSQAQHLDTLYFSSLKFSWPEYGAYLGILPLVLITLALITRFFEVRWHFLGLFFAFFISLGNFSTYSPWEFIRALPFFGQFFFIPSRWLMVVIFMSAFLAGWGLQFLWEKAQKPLYRMALWALVIVIALDLFLVSSPIFHRAFGLAPIEIEKTGTFQQAIMPGGARQNKKAKKKYTLRQKSYLKKIITKESPHLIEKYGRDLPYHEIRKIYPQYLEKFQISLPYGALSSMYPALLANKGVATSYGFSFVLPKVRWSYRIPQEFYCPHSQSVKIDYDFTPNKLFFQCDEFPTLVVVNQNYEKGWKAQDASIASLQNHQGNIAVFLNTFSSEMIIEYYPTSFVIGMVISGLTFYLGLTFLSWSYIQLVLQRGREEEEWQ